MKPEEIRRRTKALDEFMGEQPSRIDCMDAEWLLSVVNKVEGESMWIDVVVCRNECRIFYGKDKKRILRRGSTKKQAMFLALSDYCLENITVPV